jgi:rhodanese-related sulfurtransferase
MEGHLVNAINIDVESPSFASEIEKLDKSATYAVYCRSGRRSANAVATMKDAGFSSLFNLDAGVQEWTAAGLPLVAN